MTFPTYASFELAEEIALYLRQDAEDKWFVQLDVAEWVEMQPYTSFFDTFEAALAHFKAEAIRLLEGRYSTKGVPT